MANDTGPRFSLIHVNVDLAAPSRSVDKLIDTLKAAFGALFEPLRIRRRAEAEGQAAISLARARGEVQEIEQRTLDRLLAWEVRRQQNLESIVEIACDQLPDAVSDDPVDDDWIARFLGDCQDVSNERMQRVWAKILAGEVARPGAFSMRTLDVVKMLGEKDANLFTRFCTAVWHHRARPVPVLPSPHNQCLRQLQVPVGGLLHLQSLGLIMTYQLGSHGPGFTIPQAELRDLSYYGKRYSLTLPGQRRGLSLGRASLTDVGRELFQIAGSCANEDYLQMMVTHWHKQGIEIAEHGDA